MLSSPLHSHACCLVATPWNVLDESRKARQLERRASLLFIYIWDKYGVERFKHSRALSHCWVPGTVFSALPIAQSSFWCLFESFHLKAALWDSYHLYPYFIDGNVTTQSSSWEWNEMTAGAGSWRLGKAGKAGYTSSPGQGSTPWICSH